MDHSPNQILPFAVFSMLKPAEFLRDVAINPRLKSRFIGWLKPWRLKTCVDILIVVDEEIRFDGAPFGIASVIELLRTTKVGCMKFNVDIALRSNETFAVDPSPSTTEPKYKGFRFNSVHGGAAVIDKYEQIWCFGFKPNNSGSDDDALIDEDWALPAENPELEKLDQWMKDRKGGLFGTGDHHFLGASMCHKIPRLGTMRRWTNADGVPSQSGSDRIDTLRPPSPVDDFRTGGSRELGNTPHQGDLTLQPIKWRRWSSVYWPFGWRRKRPHPVLCHPELGPIDVMPDHAHEGLCVPNPSLTANKKFKGELEYPDALDGGPKPKPEIIAYGSNLSGDEWRFTKDRTNEDEENMPARSNNPMISVYDGHRAGVGRVATDSTWHHWMDININEIRAADNDDWEKVSRYFINLAIWLNPPGFTTRCLYLEIVASHFDSVGLQEYHPRASTLELGKAARAHLIYMYGPCWVTERIWELAIELNQIPIGKLMEFRDRFKNTSIDPDDFEELVLGEMVKATLKSAEQVRRGNVQSIESLIEPEKLFAKPFATAMDSLVKRLDVRSKVEIELIRDFKPFRN